LDVQPGDIGCPYNNEVPRRTFHLLLVEDNEAEVYLFREACSEFATPRCVEVANTGEAALDYLFRRGQYVHARRPDLVILDLNLPRVSGWEVLSTMKQDESLRAIPVIIASTSAEPEDVQRAYDLGAACYLQKPHDFERYIEMVQGCHRFWLHIAVLPTVRRGAAAARSTTA
jgi:CheY-like chemotaxis protein